MRQHLTIIVLLIAHFPAWCQVSISGTVTDPSGESMPYVNIYLEGTTKGTSSNLDGKFEFEVQPNASYSVVFQFVGYQKHFKTIAVQQNNVNVDIVMLPEDITLPSVIVTDDERDPAYAIIEAAQDMRKYYLKKMAAYSAQVYIKGTMRMDEMPEDLPFGVILNDTELDSSLLGLLFITESVANFYYKAPDNFKEEMLASKVAGWSQGFSWNRANDVIFNFYENDIKLGSVSEREFVSPIARDAKLFYRYQLVGTIVTDGRQIKKIKVIPKQDYYPCFHGYIYIAEDTWHIEGIDLLVTKDANIEWVDTIRFEQSYIHVKDDVFMPLSVKISYQFEVFGFAGSADYNSTFSHYEMEKEFPKGFFSNEVFTIENNANKKDSAYWDINRPVLLTNEEDDTYNEGDSLEALMTSPEYLDSLDKAINKFGLIDLLLTGYTYQKSLDSVNFYVNPLLTAIQFNTVEGWNLTFSPMLTKRYKGYSRWTLYGDARYGFSSNTLYGSGGLHWRLNARNYATLDVKGGKYVFQYNEAGPISPGINTAYSLYFMNNYMKLFQKTFANIQFGQELINGLYGKVNVEWASRDVLGNTTDFNWSKRDKEYTTNWSYPYPGQPTEAFTFEISLRYRIKQLYETYPNRKRIVGTKYPTLYAGYKKAFVIDDNYAEYDLVTLGMGEDLTFGLLGTSKFDITVGKFINRGAMAIYDYVHFNGNRTHIIQTPTAHGFGDDTRIRLSFFHTLDYYTHSTNDMFLEAHYEHHFNGWIFNKLPLLRKLRWQVVAGTNFLLSKGMVLPGDDSVIQDEWLDYTELYVGIEHIFKFFRVDVATPYQSGEKIRPEVRFGLDLNF